VDLAATGDVEKLISQALGLGLGVTAEGVETEEQLAFLRACGCDRIQGYFFARPMSGPELGAFVRAMTG
jgi:EAL domain-containing protein (putative c-di-GMP-specific phosphodiesterase class I)